MGLLPPIIAFLAASAVCLLIVVAKMARREGLGKAFFGLITVVFAFFWGSTHPKVRVSSFRLRDVMTTWMWCTGAAIVLYMIHLGDKSG
jgi:hypothetical protein